MSGNEKKVKPGFEKSLHALIGRAYEPVVPRAGFQEELLGRLRTRQQERTREKTARRGRVLRLFGGLSVVAAAAAVVLTVPLPRTTELVAPGRVTPDVSASRKEGADQPGLQPSAVERGGLALRLMTPVQMRGADGEAWESVEQGQEVQLPDQASLRAPLEGESETGVWLGDGALMALWPGGTIANNRGTLMLKKGDASVRVGGGTVPVHFRVPGYDLEITPGTKVVLSVKAGEEFAEDGAPPPQVAVLEGQVKAHGPKVSGQLLANQICDLYPTFTQNLAVRRLGEAQTRVFGNLRDPYARPRGAGPVAPSLAREEVMVPEDKGHGYDFDIRVKDAQRHTQKVKHKNGRTFVLQREGWVDTEYKPGMKLTRVIFESKDYYRLVREKREILDFVYYVARKMIVKSGDQFYYIVPQTPAR